MKNILILLVAVMVLLPIGGMAETAGTNGTNVTKFSINATYIGFDNDWFASKILINITTPRLGNLKYIEDYFTVDSYDNPKPVISNTYYNDNVTENNISFQILRPLSRSGKFYNMIRGVIIIDGKRVYESWLRTSSGAHLTFTVGNKDNAKINNNIAKFEIEYEELIADLPVTYKFLTPELAIYQVNVTGTGNDGDIALRIELLKDVPEFVKPFPWNTYKYLDISMDTYKINKIVPRYKVENAWIESNNISIYDIRLFRWNKDIRKWNILETKIIGEDNNYTYYQSEATNLSLFAIAKLNRTVVYNYNNRTTKMVGNNKSTNINQKTNASENKTLRVPKKEKPSDIYVYIGFGTIMSIIAIIMSAYVIIRNRRLKKRIEKLEDK